MSDRMDFDFDLELDKYTNVGNLLRNRRNEMEISVETIAKSLRLSILYVQMVEEGDYQNVSQKIYYFGYIRNLARYLKLNDEMLLNYLVEGIKDHSPLYNRNNSNNVNILTQSLFMKKAVEKNKSKPYFISGVLIAGLLIVAFLLQKKVNINDHSSLLMLRQKNIK